MFNKSGILYHSKRSRNKKSGQIKFSTYEFSIFLLKSARNLLIFSFLFFLILQIPFAHVSTLLHDTVRLQVPSKTSTHSEKQVYLPKIDPDLPTENILNIPSIDVYTQIQESTYKDYETALKKGVWRVPNFATPTSQDKSIILAAHRYGYLFWNSLFRRQNSFYNLPKLEVGDKVEIYWEQRKYTYEIYATDTNTRITDYSADLILYTCKDLSSDIRIFQYARLIKE